MVGYYPDDSRLVVCSPDLPITMAPHLPATKSVPVAMEPIKRKEQTAEDPYQCNICAKTFAVPARLTRHYRTHTGEKPFQCEYCAKSFSVKENLSVHRRIHTKERPYKCEVCARAFEHSGKLHRHMRIHTGERPHKCNICSKTFIQSGQLVIHMRTHTGEKPYVCTVCTKGFTCSKQLKVHSRTHTGEKPYACDICGKSFGYNHVLKLHQVAHYGEKVYKCMICNDTFNSKKILEAHIKTHSDNSAGSSCPSSSSSEKDSLTSSPPQSFPDESRYFPPTDYLPPVQYGNMASGVELLAAAASVTEDSLQSHTDVINLITSRRITSSPILRHVTPSYFQAASQIQQYDTTSLDAGNDIRRRVEAALAVASSDNEPLLTPPSSNPVSPAPSSSPDPIPIELIATRDFLSLPPRKRSKMILKSMESEPETTIIRHSSVIHYAKAS